MNEEMKFPETLDEFIKQYSFIDKKQFYTNGSELIQTFRIKQWEEHKEKENKQLKEDIKNIIKILNKNCDDLEATEKEFESLERWQNE